MTPFTAYCAPARATSQIWRVGVGVVIVVAFWLASTILVVLAYSLLEAGLAGGAEAARQAIDGLMQGGQPDRLIVILLTFSGVWAGLWIVAEALHKRPFATVFAPSGARWRRGFLAGVIAVAVYAALVSGVASLIVAPLRSPVGLETWALWLLPVAAAVFVQTTAEELLFRGYLQQQLGARFRSPLVWAGVPSVLFGLVHAANADTFVAALLYVCATTVIGLIFAIMVWRTGSLWPAIGAHWGNNLSAIAVIGPQTPLSGLQLWQFPADTLDDLLWVSLAGSVLALAAVLSPLGRVFGDGRAVIVPKP